MEKKTSLRQLYQHKKRTKRLHDDSKSASSSKKARPLSSPKTPHNPSTTPTILPPSTSTSSSVSKKPILSKSLLQAQQKLSGAQFRWLNEQLYTTPSDDAMRLFSGDPKLFDIYHEGFRRQVLSWSVNPLDVIIDELLQSERSTTLKVGDFGCGEARLAQTLSDECFPSKPPQMQRPRFEIHSFDLVAPNKYVTVADIKRVPLENASLDVAVFCLSLMGTNISEFIQEAHRTLEVGGLLIIAEVRSRFETCPPEKFVKNVEVIGFSLLRQELTSKMFSMFWFTKNHKPSIKSIPKIALKPCKYKKR